MRVHEGAVDAGPDQEQLVEFVGSVFGEWRDAVSERLQMVGMPTEECGDLALPALVTMEGALVVCRAQRSLEDFDRVASMLTAFAAAPGATRTGSPGGGGLVTTPGAGYLMCTPEMARAMMSRWISLVPSKMVKIFESRCHRSTGYSRT